MTKLNLEIVSRTFEKYGCKLLEATYINSRIPMKYQCICGNISKINFSNFRRGGRCRKCFIKKEKLSLEFIQNYFKDNNCELLETEYDKCTKPMKYKCICGNIAMISWSNFKKGRRCKECKRSKLSGENNSRWIKDREQYHRNRSFSIRCRSMLTESLKATGKRKCSKKEELLGYSVKQLKDHIENRLNWSRVSKGSWEIDHIFPIKAFIDYGIMDLKIINRLDNLQPLSSRDNNLKKDKYDPILFQVWLRSINVTY
jgi:hypothetical protein